MSTHCVQGGGGGGSKIGNFFAYVLYGWPLSPSLYLFCHMTLPTCASLSNLTPVQHGSFENGSFESISASFI